MSEKKVVVENLKKLNEDLYNKKKKLYNLRLKRVNDELKDTSLFSKTRKEIARINTKISEIQKVQNAS